MTKIVIRFFQGTLLQLHNRVGWVNFISRCKFLVIYVCLIYDKAVREDIDWAFLKHILD